MAEKPKVDVQTLLAFKPRKLEKTLTSEKAILYSLGLGFSKDPTNEKELSYTYEMHENFQILPTYSILMTPFMEAFENMEGLPAFNPMMLLHGEEKIEFFAPLKVGNYVAETDIDDVADKGKGLVLTLGMKVYEVDESNKKTLVSKVTRKLFIRQLGGFGYKGKQQEPLPKTPDTRPTAVYEEKTDASQAILYRLSGDFNPLHVDPQMAEMGGFEKPILHGLCTYGIATKGALKTFCDLDSNGLKSIAARFTSHVFPGETLIYSYWRNGDKVIFSGKTKERGKEIIQGVMELTVQPKL